MLRSIDGRRPTGAASATALAALVAAAILPGLFSLPPVDRDESRFARGARETLALPAAERWLPRLDGRPRLDKPPLPAWAQMAAVAAAGDAKREPPEIWPHRIPSLLAAIAAALATWRLGRRFLPPRAALLAGALFAISPIVLWEGAQARADLLLVAATTSALALLAPAVLSETATPLPLARAAAGWSALGIALLAKGPIALLVVLPPLLFAPRRGERGTRWLALRPATGIVVITLLAAPWLVAVARADLGAALASTAVAELPGRFLAAREGHTGFPGLHLLLAPLLSWPGSLGLPLAAMATARGFRAGERSARLLAFWVTPAWIVFELSATRLPHYTLPLYPALALAAAGVLNDAGGGALRSNRFVAILAALWRWSTLLVPIVLVGALAWKLGPAARLAAALLALFAVALHLATRSAWGERRPLPPLLGALAVAAAGGALVVGYLLPADRDLWLSPRLAAEIRRLDPEGHRPLAAAGWCEESLIYLTGGRIERLPHDGGPEWLARHPDGLLVHELGGTLRPPERELARIDGLDYVRGQRRTLSIFALH